MAQIFQEKRNRRAVLYLRSGRRPAESGQERDFGAKCDVKGTLIWLLFKKVPLNNLFLFFRLC